MTDLSSAIFSEGWQGRQGGIGFGDLQWAATGERLTEESFARSAAIEERIGHKFADANLLVTAMTHVSALKPSRKRGESYQRLEFLGDHVLGLVVSDMLYHAFPNADEGELSKRLADRIYGCHGRQSGTEPERDHTVPVHEFREFATKLDRLSRSLLDFAQGMEFVNVVAGRTVRVILR